MSQTVLVTGGSGKLGRAVVTDLQQHDYTIINADRQRGEGVRTMITDLCDAGQVYAVASRADAIVHLAAIPSPGGYPPQFVFENNVISTFNILQAASDLSIKNVVIASSLSALGTAYKTQPITLDYLPLDESHPDLPQDAYGLSKVAGERAADAFARLHPDMSIASFRFPLIVNPGEIEERARQPMPDRVVQGGGLWAYIDVRDAAIVIRQALEANIKGHEVYYANAVDTFVNEPTLDLITQYLDCTKVDPQKLQRHAAPVNCDKARKLLGFGPRYGWRDSETD